MAKKPVEKEEVAVEEAQPETEQVKEQPAPKADNRSRLLSMGQKKD